MQEKGKAIIFSAPSGSGKTTIVHHLLRKFSELEFSVSACSRDKRGNEVDGRDYYFLGLEGFQQKIKEDAFIEWEEVYKNNYYGTLKEEIDRIWAKGNTVIFDVDVVGGLNIKKAFGEQAMACFVKVPSIEVLEQRLRYRSTETEEKINMRMSKAKDEIGFADKFDEIILNDNMETALKDAEFIVSNFLNS